MFCRLAPSFSTGILVAVLAAVLPACGSSDDSKSGTGGQDAAKTTDGLTVDAAKTTDGLTVDAAGDVLPGDVARASADVPVSAGDRDAGTGRDGDFGPIDARGPDANGSDAHEGDGPTIDPCNPPAPNGYHTVHVRYLWAGKRTFTLFPKPELMPPTISFKVDPLCNTLTCAREQDRPWFNCPIPDAYFVPAAGWLVSDATQYPEWITGPTRAMPTTANEYWLRWSYGRPSVARTQDPPSFEFLDYYPDGAYGDWAAMGQWNDDVCVRRQPASPVIVGFGQGGWFPYPSASHQYAHGGSLARVYPNVTKTQDALDAFVFDRYKLWKKNWIKRGADACGAGTARVVSDGAQGTTSSSQGYGMAMSAALGDKELFAELWAFVRRYRSQAKYCGLAGWMWQSAADCQPLDSFATSGGNHDSAFGGDVDIGIGLVYAAQQWPEYTDAATDWLARMECEVNAKTGDGWNYPSTGDAWDKSCSSAGACDYAPNTVNHISLGDYPPGHFRVFGDFLAAKLGTSAIAANGQRHRDFWYKTAATVYELVERCFDQEGIHPALLGSGGDSQRPCGESGGEPHQWEQALWRLAVDAAWFGNDRNLPENKTDSSQHFPGKSRMQAKLDSIQGFFADFHKTNPPEPNANRFSSICEQLSPSGTVSNCDPSFGHTPVTVNVALSAFASAFDNGGATTTDIRRQALEESLSTAVLSEHSTEESFGVYTLLFLTGNLPNPMSVPRK
jgi:hypothetical protein